MWDSGCGVFGVGIFFGILGEYYLFIFCMSFENKQLQEAERMSVESLPRFNQLERDWKEVMSRQEVGATVEHFSKGCGQDLVRALGTERFASELRRFSESGEQGESVADFLVFVAPDRKERMKLLQAMIDEFHQAEEEYKHVEDREESAHNNLTRRKIQLEYLVRRERPLVGMILKKTGYDMTRVENFKRFAGIVAGGNNEQVETLFSETEKGRVEKRDGFRKMTRDLQHPLAQNFYKYALELQQKEGQISRMIEDAHADRIVLILGEIEKIRETTEGMSEETRAAMDSILVSFERRIDEVLRDMETEKQRLCGPLAERMSQLVLMERNMRMNDYTLISGL